MAQTINVRLNKGEAPSLGFRLQGGKDFGTPLVIQKVNIGSPAEKSGLLAGDSVIRINTTDVYNLRHKDAQDVIIRAGPSFEITVQRGGSTWKPAVTPTSALPTTANSYSPVTKTSLAAKPQPSIGAIGTGHNLSAKPFPAQVNGTVNGGPKFVNKQYNTPLGLYSEQSIAETLSAQAEVLSTGVLGVNFKKNEKNYDASNSAVFRMVQEADKEPRDAEAEPDSGVVSTPIGVAGLRHVSAPEAKAAPATPQLPPGQNICADCERLIVGVFVRIKDKNLHVECFKCSTCGTSLKNVGYYNISNKLYCDVHAKLAAISSASSPNLIPVTVPPGGKAPAGTISAALASRPLPTVGPISPLSPASNVTAQPFQQQPEATPGQVPVTELDGVIKQDEDHVVKLFKNVTLAASRKKDNANQVFVSEKVIPINNNYIVDPLKAASPIPYTQFVAKASGTFTSNPRPFSSVSSPLSPPLNSYSSLPKSSPVAAPPFSSTPAAPVSEHENEVDHINEHDPPHSPVFAQKNTPLLAQPDRTSKADVYENYLSDPPPLPKSKPPPLSLAKDKSSPTQKKLIQMLDVQTNNNGMELDVAERNHTNDVNTNNALEETSEDTVPVCVVCNSEIERGPFITALGKIWCPEHFICATPSCRRPLQDLGFVEEQGQLYCEYCFEQYLAPPCAKCSSKIKGDCLKAIGKNFHPECFNCSYCGKLFGNSPFFLEDGAPYCENDWNELFTTKCFACGFPVEAGDRWVEALNNNYHSQCFNCTMCKKNLEGQSFFAKGGRPFCKNHAR